MVSPQNIFSPKRKEQFSCVRPNSDEWHADETIVKMAGVKHYVWFVIDSETRFVIGALNYCFMAKAFLLFL